VRNVNAALQSLTICSWRLVQWCHEVRI